MDLTSLYSDFVMDGREVLFHSAPGYVSSFHDNDGTVYCAIPAFQHSDADFAWDPLSTNRCRLTAASLILHDMATVCNWPHGARGELFVVARCDIAVARRNLARLTHYVDLQDDHLAACDGALDDGIPR